MKYAMLIAGLFVAGCTTVPADPALIALASREIQCTAGPDCDAKWSRVVTWVAQTSRWKIQTQTADLIQTAGPFDTTSAAFTISKVAIGNGTYRILYAAGCGNMFGCVPSLTELKVSFIQFVDGAS